MLTIRYTSHPKLLCNSPTFHNFELSARPILLLLEKTRQEVPEVS
jgi:hypothetical protein